MSDLRNSIGIEENLRQEVIQACMQRDDAEKEVNVLKEKIGNLNLELLRQRNEIDKLNREKILNNGNAYKLK